MKILFYILASLLMISCDQSEKSDNTTLSENPAKVEVEIIEKENSIDTHIFYEIGNVTVQLNQTKSDGTEFYCKSKIVTIIDNNVIDSLSYTPEPVGGHYGISIPNQIENHLVFTKHGDYDGRTILINEKGLIFDIIGGGNYYDSESKLLFTNYYSDLGGFAVFDIQADTVIMEMSDFGHEPISFHKAFGERYFFHSINNDLQDIVMEIELDLNGIMQVDLDSNQINNTNVLATWDLENVNCECDKQ